MSKFKSVKELTNVLQRGADLLNDMFLKRKTLSLKYDDAVETLKGDENKLKQLINSGVIIECGDTLELDNTYQSFFENVLEVNEDINTALVKTYIDKLKSNIKYYLSTGSSKSKIQYVREIRRTFDRVERTTRRNVIDLKRNVNYAYKQEPDFKIKKLKLEEFDEKAKLISDLIRQTEKVIDDETIFFAQTSEDIGMRQTISEVKSGLNDSAHALISISELIIDYLNRIEYQNMLVRKVRQLKYLKDQMLIEDRTDIQMHLGQRNDLWMENQPKYITKVSLDFLRNEDAALAILQDVRKRIDKKSSIKSHLAGKIDQKYLTENQERSYMFNHTEIMNGFFAQSNDLFNYLLYYNFSVEVDFEKRLVLFLQLASQYDSQLNYTFRTGKFENIEYPLIYSA